MVFVDHLITNIFFEAPICLNTSTLFASRNIENSEIRLENDILRSQNNFLSWNWKILFFLHKTMEKTILNLHVKFHDFYPWNNEDTKILNFGFSKPSKPDLLSSSLKYDSSKKKNYTEVTIFKRLSLFNVCVIKEKTWTL